MKNTKNLSVILITLILCSCYKQEHTRVNKYDPLADVTRTYTLAFDHVEVKDIVVPGYVADGDGLLEVNENAELHVYLKNNGTDPCLLSEGTFDEVVDVNGFYIKNFDIGTNDGGLQFLGSSATKGYTVQYIDPGATDYLKVDVHIYPACTNQDVSLVFMLTDYDGEIHQVNFSVHVE